MHLISPIISLILSLPYIHHHTFPILNPFPIPYILSFILYPLSCPIILSPILSLSLSPILSLYPLPLSIPYPMPYPISPYHIPPYPIFPLSCPPPSIISPYPPISIPCLILYNIVYPSSFPSPSFPTSYALLVFLF